MGVNGGTKEVTLTPEQRAIVVGRIKAGIAFRAEVDRNKGSDKDKFPSRVERDLALVAGNYWEERDEPDVRWVNYVAPALQVRADVVPSGKTQFLCKPTAAKFAESLDADSSRNLLNYYWRILRCDTQTTMAQWDAPIHRKGVVEIGWIYDADGIEVRGQAEEVQEPNPMMIGGQMVPPSYEEFGSPEEAQLAATAMQAGVRVPKGSPAKDQPFLERFDPRDFILDPQSVSPDLSDARFAFRRKQEYLSRVKGNRRYHNTEELKPTRSAYFAGNENDEKKNRLDPSVREDVEMVEIYDGYVKLDVDGSGREQLLHVVMAKGNDKELLAEPTPYDAWTGENPYPFEVLWNWKPDNDKQEPASDVTQVAWMQIMDDQARTQRDDKRSKSNDVLLLEESILEDPELVEKLKSGRQNEMIPVKRDVLPFIKWLERPQFNYDAYQTLAETPDKIREQLGVASYQMNSNPDRKLLATEVLAMQEQGGTRQNGDREHYFDFECRCAYKVLTLLQQFGSWEMEFSTPGDNGEENWGTATQEQIRGKANEMGQLEKPGIQWRVELDATSVPPRSRMADRAQWNEFVGQLVPFLQAPDPDVPGRPLINIRYLLQQMAAKYEVADVSKLITPPPSPEDKEAMMLQQMQQMAATIEQLQAELEQLGQAHQEAQGAVEQLDQVAQGEQQRADRAEQRLRTEVQRQTAAAAQEGPAVPNARPEDLLGGGGLSGF